MEDQDDFQKALKAAGQVLQHDVVSLVARVGLSQTGNPFLQEGDGCDRLLYLGERLSEIVVARGGHGYGDDSTRGRTRRQGRLITLTTDEPRQGLRVGLPSALC